MRPIVVASVLGHELLAGTLRDMPGLTLKGELDVRRLHAPIRESLGLSVQIRLQATQVRIP